MCLIAARHLALHSLSTTPLPQINITLTAFRCLPFSSPSSQKLLTIVTNHLLIHFESIFFPPSRWLSSRSRPSPAPWLSSVLSPPVLSPMSFLSFPRLLCVCFHPKEAPRLSLTCIQPLRLPLTSLSLSSMASPPLTVRDTPLPLLTTSF